MRRCPSCGNLTTSLSCIKCTDMPTTIPITKPIREEKKDKDGTM